ncbi:hypothetical protein EXIGLDRAFT_767837 [Exidia glandulosa HHB12029]|uniref:Uncharacterized protein n=1 Tax=Exidia glandulosa HHB12029 TaxID=1314781 RepID=A0A165IQG6_EXIGL|nr:hypothetical protein EXIGLDRAFT_767837 [Exidia glandulosa HHB12029]
MLLPRLVLVALPLLCQRAAADTEIVNFTPEPSDNVDIGQRAAAWRVLQPGAAEILDIEPAPRQPIGSSMCNSTTQDCPHEHWLVLETASPGMHTIRISYPATSSVSYSIKTFSHAALVSYLSLSNSSTALQRSQTLRSYARITSQRIGALTPGIRYVEPSHVKYHVTLERLIFGVIPPSTLPVVAAVVLVLVTMCFAVPRLFVVFDALTRDAARDVQRKGQ